MINVVHRTAMAFACRRALRESVSSRGTTTAAAWIMRKYSSRSSRNSGCTAFCCFARWENGGVLQCVRWPCAPCTASHREQRKRRSRNSGKGRCCQKRRRPSKGTRTALSFRKCSGWPGRSRRSTFRVRVADTEIGTRVGHRLPQIRAKQSAKPDPQLNRTSS